MTYSAKIITGGKIVIPAEIRRALGLADGDTLVIEREGDTVVLKSRTQVVREVQQAFRAMVGPPARGVVDELIADRRNEAAREQGDRGAA